MTKTQIGLSIAIVLAVSAAGVLAFPYRGAIEEALHIKPADKKQAHFLFVGDMMFDRSLRAVAQEKGYDFLFSCLADELTKYDEVIGNLEGPITNNLSQSLESIVNTPENYTFTFAPEVAPLLKRHNISLVNLGNNHMLNFSRDGLLQTKKYLTEAGVRYFGDPDSIENERVGRFTYGGINFSFVNWSDWTSDNTDITGNQIKAEAESGRTVIVYTHWGEEYVPATERMKRLAHQFIDQGASIVIGSHPHVVQEHEIYRDKHIYYSLGNFIFDQYWNDEVSRGLALDITYTDKNIAIVEKPVVLTKDRRTCFVEQTATVR